MKSTLSCTEWEKVLENFGKHKGTIASFCKQYQINQHQLYYQRKKLDSEPTTFVSLPIEEDTRIATNDAKETEQSTTTMNISIGKATLKLETINADNLRLVLKILLDIC